MRKNRCVNCSLLIPRNHQEHLLQKAPTTMITILQSWITPTELSSESVLCTECMVLLQNRANIFNDDEGGTLPLPAYGHRSVCLSCGLSILRVSRTYTVRSDRQERNIILRNVPLHLVSRLERVCSACWMSAYREVKRQSQPDTNRPTPPDLETSGDSNIPAPPPLPQHACQPSPPKDKITSSVYRRAANAANRCIFVDCFESERLCIPVGIKKLLLLNYKFYIPRGARICRYHLNLGQWNKLTSRLRDFTGTQFDNILNMLHRAAKHDGKTHLRRFQRDRTKKASYARKRIMRDSENKTVPSKQHGVGMT